MAGSEFDAYLRQTDDFLLPEHQINMINTTTASTTVDQLDNPSGFDTSSSSAMADFRSFSRATQFDSAVVTPSLTPVTPHVHHSDYMVWSVAAPDLERSASLQGPTQGNFASSLDEILPGNLMYGVPSLKDWAFPPIETPAVSTSESPSSTSSTVFHCRVDSCNKTSVDKRADDKHFIAVHQKQHRCRVPGCPALAFGHRADLRRHHNNIHLKRRAFVCPVPTCGRPFSRKDNLGRHMHQMHGGGKH